MDLSKIDRVPVSFVEALGDKLCLPEKHDAWYHQIKSPDKYVRYERGGHLIFGLKDDDAFTRRIV